jgi:hypothetical protein
LLKTTPFSARALPNCSEAKASTSWNVPPELPPNWYWFQPAELRALVTDVELGEGPSGLELAQYAKRKFPDLNVVIVSGRDPAYVPLNTLFLLKPYRAQELLDAVLS